MEKISSGLSIFLSLIPVEVGGVFHLNGEFGERVTERVLTKLFSFLVHM